MTAAPVQFGFMELPRSLDETARLARHADEAGYAWLGIADSPTVYQESYLHQFEALKHSTRLRVGPLVSHVVARHPVIVANLLATLNEAGGGRTVGVIGTGNSAARGLGLRPATAGDLRAAVGAIRGYWAGRGGAYRDTAIPPTGITRAACPLLVAADGPRITEAGGQCGDGVLYGGTMKADVLARRVAAARAPHGTAPHGTAPNSTAPDSTAPDSTAPDSTRFWIGPAVSLGETIDEVLEDMGAMVVAMANRAFRGDLAERGIPDRLHPDVQLMWQRYDYAFHADTTRPRNLEVVSRPLAEYLVENFVIWGDERRWAQRLGELAAQGCDGVMFILGQDDQHAAVLRITERLRRLALLPSPAGSRP